MNWKSNGKSVMGESGDGGSNKSLAISIGVYGGTDTVDDNGPIPVLDSADGMVVNQDDHVTL